jgi:hypothetical protein
VSHSRLRNYETTKPAGPVGGFVVSSFRRRCCAATRNCRRLGLPLAATAAGSGSSWLPLRGTGLQSAMELPPPLPRASVEVGRSRSSRGGQRHGRDGRQCVADRARRDAVQAMSAPAIAGAFPSFGRSGMRERRCFADSRAD